MVWMLVVGCAAGSNPGDGEDSDPPVVDCLGERDEVQFAPKLADGPMGEAAEIGIGTPPQSGPPYAPFEVRVHADIAVTDRIDVHGDVYAAGTEERLGTITQSQAFLCANAGPHLGWRFGGEIHVRFHDFTNEELDGRDVDVHVQVDLPTETVEARGSGRLAWTLGL